MDDDLKQLQGTWTVTSLEVEGQQMPDAMLSAAQIVIKGTRFTSSGMGATYTGTLKLDPSTDPPQLDMKFDAGPEAGNTNPGIYKLDGDSWQLCLSTRGTTRPTQFVSTPGSGLALEILTRGAVRTSRKSKAVSAKATAEAPQKRQEPTTEFEGEWQMVSGVMNGVPIERSAVQWVRRVTTGRQTIVYAGPQTMMKMEFATDSSKSPKAIDYFNTGGSNKGTSQLGIFEFEGDLLRVCTAAPGAARPSAFQSVPGDGTMFTIWKRVR
jgi:uncharacterized protein (TIGR03067 family)